MTRRATRHSGRVFDNIVLVDLRLAAFRTQAEVAKAVGVGVRQYQRWEGGESQPQLRHIRALGSVFECDPGAFFKTNGREAA